MRMPRLLILVSVLVILGGCAKSKSNLPTLHPVTGVVTRGGQPVGGGVISLNSEPPDANIFINAVVNSDGTFEVLSSDPQDKQGAKKPGAPAGAYKLTYHPEGSEQQDPFELDKSYVVEAKSNQWTVELPPKQ